jgi:hypothetical protein
LKNQEPMAKPLRFTGRSSDRIREQAERMRANLVCFRAGSECRSMSRMLRLPQTWLDALIYWVLGAVTNTPLWPCSWDRLGGGWFAYNRSLEISLMHFEAGRAVTWIVTQLSQRMPSDRGRWWPMLDRMLSAIPQFTDRSDLYPRRSHSVDYQGRCC